GADWVVSNAAGCGALLRGYGELLPGEPEAAAVGARARDALALLAELGLPSPSRPLACTIAVHDPCHLAPGQGVRAQVRQAAGAHRRPAVTSWLRAGPLQPVRRLAGARFRSSWAERLRDHRIAQRNSFGLRSGLATLRAVIRLRERAKQPAVRMQRAGQVTGKSMRIFALSRQASNSRAANTPQPTAATSNGRRAAFGSTKLTPSQARP